MTDANGRWVILDPLIFLIWIEGLQDGSGLPTLQAILLRFHPCLVGLPGHGDDLGGRVERVADREEIQQIVSILAKPLFHLTGYPTLNIPA
jgi:hypothetical protein